MANASTVQHEAMRATWPNRSSSDSQPTVTVLLTTFAGLGLPRTLSLPTPTSTLVRDLLQTIYSRLPRVDHALVITTTANKQLLFSSDEPISTLLSSEADTFLPLRLSAKLCGGKGGFGSQLRAAGGRMSSRKNRNQQNQNTNGSNRNLDGRRLRTVDQAKRLADYLATKSDLENKQKADRKERLARKIQDAEDLEDRIKSGRMGSGQGRLDAEYVESKELAEEKTRDAVLKSMRDAMVDAERTGSESSMEVDVDASDDGGAGEGSSGSSEDATADKFSTSGPSYYGWGDDEEEDESDDEEEDIARTEPNPGYQGDGKGKAKAYVG